MIETPAWLAVLLWIMRLIPLIFLAWFLWGLGRAWWEWSRSPLIRELTDDDVALVADMLAVGAEDLPQGPMGSWSLDLAQCMCWLWTLDLSDDTAGLRWRTFTLSLASAGRAAESDRALALYALISAGLGLLVELGNPLAACPESAGLLGRYGPGIPHVLERLGEAAGEAARMYQTWVGK